MIILIMAGTTSHPTHYQVLGVDESAGFETIQKAYRTLAKKHHPDMGGSAREMHKITRAYEVLKNTTSRNAYDKTLHVEPVKTPAAPPKPSKPTPAEVVAHGNISVEEVRRSGLKSLFAGIAIIIVGIIITAIGYNSAEVGGTYTVFYGLFLWGGYLLIKGWYALLTPSNKERSPKRAAGIITVSIISILILVVLIISGLGGASSTSSSTVLTSESASLKSTYDACTSKYDGLVAQLDSVEGEMSKYDSYNNTDGYNKLVPQQNSLASELNAKAAECEGARTAYNDSL